MATATIPIDMEVGLIPHANLRFEGLNELVGRERELREIRARLGTARLVTLTGPGGVGKTRLAAAIAIDRGAPIVDLSPIRDARLVAAEIAVAVEADPQSDRPIVERIARALDGDGALLVLDNVEQIAAVANVIGGILVAAPRLTILATSRSPTGLNGEAIVQVDPLPLPDEETPAAVAGSPAAMLLLSLARNRGPGEPLDDRSAGPIAALVRRLDGLPLALELAAARLPLYSPAAIVRHLATDADAFLLDRDAGRHGTLGAVLDWSVQLLQDDVRRGLFDLAAIPSAFGLDLAAAVIGDDDPIRILDELVEQCLVVARRGLDGEPRFVMLETIRASCLARQTPAGLDAAMARLAAYVADEVRRFGMRDLLTVTSEVRRLTPLGEAIRAALEWAAGNDIDAAFDIAIPSGDFWHARGQDDVCRAWLVRLLDTGAGSTTRRRHAEARIAMLNLTHGPTADAGSRAERIVRDASTAGDLVAEACARYVLACVAAADRSEAEAEAEVRRLVRLADEAAGAEAAGIRLWALRGRAVVADLRQDPQLAVAANEALADASAEEGLPALEAFALTNSIDSSLVLGRTADARRQAERAVELYESAGPWVGIGWPYAQLARACARLGDEPAARLALERAIADARVHGNAVVIASTLEAALAYATAFGDPAVGCRAFGALEADAEAAGPAVLAIARRVAEPDLARARRQIGAVNVDAAIAAGSAMTAAAILDEVAASLTDGARPSRPHVPLRHGDLSRREIEVMRLLAAGRSDPDIARTLFISPKTASVHVSNIKAKLGVQTRVEAVLRSREMLDPVSGSG